MDTLKEQFCFAKEAEITIEVNPGSAEEEKLLAYYKSGINRLSIGLQSSHNSELQHLSIGVVVDDCIVVVERVQYLIETRGLNSKEAAIQAMKDVTSAVIATTLVLLGIFVPVGFMSGITGRIYQQFSVTLSAAVCFSTVCALTLAPALCSLLLHEAQPYKRGPFAWFNKGLDAFKGFFVTVAKWLASRIFLTLVLLVLVVLLTVQMFSKTETAFLPEEDQSVVFCSMEMPEGTARDRSRETALRAVELLRTVPEVQSVISITGRARRPTPRATARDPFYRPPRSPHKSLQ